MRSLSAGGADPGYLKELQVTLDGVDELARLWAAWRASVDGRSEVAPAETVAPSVYEVTTGEAAGILGVSPRRVVQLLHEGALSGRRVGRTWLVDRASVVLRRGW
jgi:excisionase family DNA binding protein